MEVVDRQLVARKWLVKLERTKMRNLLYVNDLYSTGKLPWIWGGKSRQFFI
jgi:hypothetical protein